MVWREAELLLQCLERRGGAKRAHPDDRTAKTDVAFPAEGGRLFDRHTRDHVWRQDAVPVLLGLLLDRIACDSALAVLVQARFLIRTPRGAYLLRDGK